MQSVAPNAERIEFLDAKGATIFALDIEQPDSSTALDAGDRDTKLLNLLVKAQELALDRQLAGMASMMKGYENLARMMAERLTSLEKGYSQVLQAAFDSTMMAAEAQAKLNGEVDKGEDQSAIDKLAGEVLGKLVGGGVDAAANGVVHSLDKPKKAASAVVQKG